MADTYTVIVGNIGTVYDGPDYGDARQHFLEYRTQSLAGYGRAGGEPVTWLRGGEPIVEHDGIQQTGEED